MARVVVGVCSGEVHYSNKHIPLPFLQKKCVIHLFLVPLRREIVIMYIERAIDQALLEWKDRANRKPLLLRGARQIAIRHLGDFKAMRPYFAIGDKKRRMFMEKHF